MDTKQYEKVLLDIKNILSNDYFKIDIRTEKENYNIYTQKESNSNFEFQFSIPTNLINKEYLKKILANKKCISFFDSKLKEIQKNK
jgi:hypothetical protein